MNKKVVIPILIVVFFLGAFFRLAYNTEIYTEGDDIGVVSLYKSNAPDHDIRLFSDKIIDINVKVKAEGIKNNLLDSWLFPVFVGRLYTYPPGLFSFFPIFISEDDDYLSRLGKGRAIVGILNFIGIPLLLYLLFLLNNKKWNDNFLLPLLVLAFSFNSVLYSNNISPYAIVATIYIIALILFLKAIKKELSLVVFFSLLGALTYFNYLIILLLPPFTLVYLYYHKIFSPKRIIKKFILPGILYGLVFLPGYLIFFKGGAGFCCTAPPELLLANIFKIIAFLPMQFVNAFSSGVAFFSTINYLNIIFVVFILISTVYFFVKDFKKGNNNLLWSFVLLGFIFWLEWIALYSFKKISMDRTRHILVWLPMFSVCFYYLLVKFEELFKKKNIFKYYKNIYFVIVIALIAVSSFLNYQILHSKFNLTDYKLIAEQNIDTIVSYNMLDGALYLNYPNKNVYNIESPYFVFCDIELTYEFLMYSQEVPINIFLNQVGVPQAVKNINAILDDYDLESIKEEASNAYFYYDNFSLASNVNNFYLYKFTRKK